MNILLLILLFNFLGSIISLVGGLILLSKKDFLAKTSHLLSSFAAGTLLGAAFFDLLPEALEHGEEMNIESSTIFIWVLCGILFFFLLERFLHWFHHHGLEIHELKSKPVIPLVIIGDSIHNFIDGVAIATTFLVNIPVGILTTFAVAAHEIPQEIGDFGVMIKNGMSRRNTLLINILSAFISFIGALIAFHFGRNVVGVLPFFLSIASGFFLYIALSDLIPEIHHENRKGIALWETLFLLSGVFVMYGGIYIIENVFGITP